MYPKISSAESTLAIIQVCFGMPGAYSNSFPAQLKNYAKSPLQAKDASTGKAITDFKRVAQVWVAGEPKVRAYASPESAFADLKKLEAAGKKIRVVYAQDRNSGIKLLAQQAWFAADAKGQLHAFLQKDAASEWAASNKGRVLDYLAAREQTTKLALK